MFHAHYQIISFPKWKTAKAQKLALSQSEIMNRDTIYHALDAFPFPSLFHMAGTPFFNSADAISYFLLSSPSYIRHQFSLTLGCPGNVFYLSVVVDLIVCLATSQLQLEWGDILDWKLSLFCQLFSAAFFVLEILQVCSHWGKQIDDFQLR